MRIKTVSNEIVSAVYNPISKPTDVMNHVCDNHDLVFYDHIIAECYDVVERIFPHHLSALDNLFAKLSYELVATPRTGWIISDPKDSPILNASLLAAVDVIISGERHFFRWTLSIQVYRHLRNTPINMALVCSVGLPSNSATVPNTVNINYPN